MSCHPHFDQNHIRKNFGMVCKKGTFRWLQRITVPSISTDKKIKENNSDGLSERSKLVLQTVVAIGAILTIFWVLDLDTKLQVPFMRSFKPDLGWFYIPFAWFIIVGSSNAVNLTDGLDGLAIGPVISTAITFGVFAYLAGHVKLADYLYISHVADAGELSIFCATMVCARPELG